VLLHELSHSLVARSRGLKVDSITLFIFGGVSNLSSEATSPGDEFLVAVVGPLSSIVLAGVFWLLGQSLSASSPIGAVLGYLAYINLLLGGFNLIPGFPLDGGFAFSRLGRHRQHAAGHSCCIVRWPGGRLAADHRGPFESARWQCLRRPLDCLYWVVP
jgi:membrane-associated protease RseP (regulator of RpoE activity)